MTILEAQSLERPGDALAQRLMEPGILGVPGAHHALCGLIAKRSGFRALYLSGAALSASMGLPDLGIITQDELCSAVKSLYRATSLPIIVDGDTGYGEALNVMRLVRDLEEAGASAIQLEDGSTMGPVNELIDAIVKGGEVKSRQEGKASETMRENCLTLH